MSTEEYIWTATAWPVKLSSGQGKGCVDLTSAVEIIVSLWSVL